VNSIRSLPVTGMMTYTSSGLPRTGNLFHYRLRPIW
jgi:hypothetical protein